MSDLESNLNRIIVVSGLPRSGTSMMMKMLEAGGIPPLTDKLREADEDNPKGYYEFERVKKLPKGDIAWLPDAVGKTVKVIAALLQFLPSNYQYAVVLMRRSMEEILASQRQMLIRRGEDPDAMDDTIMAGLFEKHMVQTENWIATQPNIRTLDINYNAIMMDPPPHISAVNDFLGGGLNIDGMMGVVDPNLYRQRN
jgi:hypothetical protein